MRRVTTWLLVATLGAVGAIAVADALRGSPQAVPATAPAVSTADHTLTTTLSPPVEGGLGGVLYYTNQSCRLRGIELPSLRAAETPAWAGCEFSLAPSGRGIQSEAAVWDPAGVAWAAENSPNVVLVSGSSSSVTLRGSAPAFRPDGTFTYARGGSVRALRGDCGRTSSSAIILPARAALACSRMLVAPEELRGSLPDPRGRRVRVRTLAWLDDERLVALVETDEATRREEVVAIFEEGSLVRAIPSHGQRFGRLWASPGGGFFAVETEVVLLFDRDGNPAPAPPVGRVRSLAWAPDESWAAVATEQDVYLFLTGTTDMRLRRLGIVARDLAWRGVVR
jgi:hypothetical protein